MFLQDIVRLHGSANAVKKKNLMLEVAEIWYKAMRLKDRAVALSLFS